MDKSSLATCLVCSDVVKRSHVAKEISGRGRRKTREKGNKAVGGFRFINILHFFYFFLIRFTFYFFIKLFFLRTAFAHTHDPHPRPTTHDLYPLPTTFSYTLKTVNTWNISGMFIVLWPITAKITTYKLATKPQTKGLFTWGTLGRWGNPLRWGKENNPPLHAILQPRHPRSIFKLCVYKLAEAVRYLKLKWEFVIIGRGCLVLLKFKSSLCWRMLCFKAL